MTTADDVAVARAELDHAVRKWLKAKAKYVDEGDGYDDEQTALIQADDPVMLGWALIAVYTSTDLEQADSTAYSYECPDGQPAAFSRGLSMSGVDRWSNR